MVMLDYMKMLKQFMNKERFQVRMYPTILSDEHNAILCKKIMEDGIRLNDALLSKDIYGISEQIAESLFSLFGMCNTMGIPIESVFDEVWRAKYYKKRCNVNAALRPTIDAKIRAYSEKEKDDKENKL